MHWPMMGYSVQRGTPTAEARFITNGRDLNKGRPRPAASSRNQGRTAMSRKVTRRALMAGTAAGAAAAAFNFPMPAIAQGAPFRLGLLTVKTGPLAQGGI